MISKAGRPEDGTDPKPINMAEVPGGREAAGRVARRCHQGAADRPDGQRAGRRCPASSRASRSRSATTCSRASRRSTARSSSRSSATTSTCCGSKADEVLQHDLAGPRRRARVRRPRGPGAAAADRNRPGAGRALRPERRRRRGRDRDGARRQDRRPKSGRASGSSDVVVRLRRRRAPRHRRRSRNVLVDTPERPAQSRSTEVATFGRAGGSMNIAARSGTRVAAIGVFIQGRDMGSVVSEMQQRVEEQRQASARLLHRPGAASSKTSSAPWRGSA